MTTETFQDIFAWLERVYPDKDAIADGRNVSWTFGELCDYSRRACAGYRQFAGLRKGDRIGWLSFEPTAALLSLSFGARKMGAIPVIMNSRASPEALAWMINNVQVEVLSYTRECRDLLERVRSVGIPCVRQYLAMDEPINIPGEVLLNDVYSEFERANEPEVAIGPEDVCFIAYTSGTTGQPKPVVHLEREWSWTTLMMAHVLGISHKDVTAVVMPPSFIGWAHVTCASLRVAAKQASLRFHPRQFVETVAKESVTHSLLSATLVRMLYSEYRNRTGSWMTESLRVCAVGGEPITVDVHNMFREMFPNAARISSLGATEGILLHSGVQNPYITEHFQAIGKPLPGVTAELRDEETGEVIEETGRPGVLYARGPGIAAGIWNDRDATETNFPGGWWRTGDVLQRDKEGYYSYSGRSDHMFKSGGIKVFAEDVERKLKSHPAVLDAVVVPVSDAKFGFVPFAHVRHSEPVNAEMLEEWWSDKAFEGYNRPRHWKFWGEHPFPMLTDVKIDRKALARMV
jgi:acyl-coenzyme A synthetase/AMP-(fatty) acid ligase